MPMDEVYLFKMTAKQKKDYETVLHQTIQEGNADRRLQELLNGLQSARKAK
jgi:hypothetical protein